MQILDVGSNQITGNLSVIESMPLGTEFRFDGNQMTGSIPQISSNVQVGASGLSAAIAACSTDLCCNSRHRVVITNEHAHVALQVLDLQSNNLTGLVPTFRGTAMVELRTSFNPQLEWAS